MNKVFLPINHAQNFLVNIVKNIAVTIADTMHLNIKIML